MHLPTASQISSCITTSLGESGKLCNARDVRSRNIKVNGIFQNLSLCVSVRAYLGVCSKSDWLFFGGGGGVI